MTESFLHYIWQHQLFDHDNLVTDDGQVIEVIRPGMYNTNSGPDFFNSLLKIDGTLWAGNVEIHIQSGDWQRHNHQLDPAYDSCILHVVYENNNATLRMNGTRIPSIELRNKIPSYLWENYLRLIGSKGWISCQHRIEEIDENTWNETIDKMIHERLEKRKDQILISLKGNKDDWEECFYQAISKNFGFQLNAVPFEMLARSLPLKIIRKEYNTPVNIEALLFGQAGMLNDNFEDDYPKKIQEIYNHLSKKYSLLNIQFSSWKFLRLRPMNFPAIRLAQFSSLLSKHPVLFNTLLESTSLKNIFSLFNVEASEYWNTHYHFNKSSNSVIKRLGNDSTNNILINTFIPFLYSWGKYTGNDEMVNRAFSFLKRLSSENNFIIRHWKELGVKSESAEYSQSLIQLKIEYCSEKKCLECSIGKKLVGNVPTV